MNSGEIQGNRFWAGLVGGKKDCILIPDQSIECMKIIYKLLMISLVFAGCDTRSKYKKAADEIAAKIPTTSGLNAGDQNYKLYVPEGWTTDHKTAYGINYYFLNAPKTADDPNTNVNVVTENMQNLSLEDYDKATIKYVRKAIPSAGDFKEGSISAHGLGGLWYSYKMDMQGVKASLVSYVFPRNGIAYIITAGTQTKDEDRYRSLFDSVARSLEFIDEVPVKK